MIGQGRLQEGEVQRAKVGEEEEEEGADEGHMSEVGEGEVKEKREERLG